MNGPSTTRSLLHPASFCLAAILAGGAVTAQTTIDFGTSPVGPITNNQAGSGDFRGDEYASLGVRFSPATADVLNIGCGTQPGDPFNCLGADRVSPNDFDGTVFAHFRLGTVRQVTNQVAIRYANPASPPTRTIIRAPDGRILLDQQAGDVSFSDPNIAEVEMRMTFDGANDFSFGPLLPCAPASFALGPRTDGCGPTGGHLELIVARAANVGKIGLQHDIGMQTGPNGSAGVFAFGTTDRAPYPIDLSFMGATRCQLRNDVIFVVTTTFLGGGSTPLLPVGIPNNSYLCGARYFVQGVAAWPSANPAGLATSNQLTVDMGN